VSILYFRGQILNVLFMKSFCVLMITVLLCVSSCKSDSDFSLPEFWYNSCANFVADEYGYKHEGRCCEWVSIPKFDLKRNQSFSVEGKYNRYTESSGENVSDRPITISGTLSPDGKTLQLNYVVDGEPLHYEMMASESLIVCSCQCYFK